MNLIILSLKLLDGLRRSFELATKDPLKTQEAILLQYLRRNENTEYGRKYNFNSIHSIEDFRNMVPLTSYEKLRKYVNRMARGEQNVLTKDKVIFFGATSGTTNKPKLIPTTNYSEKKKEELMNLWSYYISLAHPDVLDGKILAVVSPEIEGVTDSGIPFGAESGYSYRTLPKIVMILYSLPYEVLEIADYEARHYAILRISIEQNITTIATLNPNTMVLLFRKIERWQEMIIDDIERGTLSNRLEIPDRVRKVIEKRLKPNPRRAGELRNILKRHKALLPKYFWPQMKLIECWQGGMMKLYLKELDKYFGRVPKRDIGCVSTEARSSIPIRDGTPSGVLAIQTNFYEFIPKDEPVNPNTKTLLCTQLKKGKEYFIVVTTAGGLYRYNIDDIVRVTGFLNKTPLIEFVQKGLGASSLAGEKLYESHINETMTRVLKREKILIDFFCAVAKPLEGPRYVFLVEFSEKYPTAKRAARLLAAIEKELHVQNREYDFVRNAQLLNKPVMKILKKGSFENYRSKRIGEGAQEGQFKVPQITTNPDFERNFIIEKVVQLPDSAA